MVEIQGELNRISNKELLVFWCRKCSLLPEIFSHSTNNLMWLVYKLKSYLLHNTSTKQTIIKNTFRLMLAEWISKGSLFILSILIARQLGPEQFGIMSFVMSFVTIFIVLIDFGLTTLMIREVSRDQSKLSEYFVNGNFLKVILGIITFGIVRCVSKFIGKPDFYITLILIYCGYAIITNIGEFIRSFFRPSEHMQYEALLKIINGALLLVIVWGVLWKGYWLQSIFYAYLIAGIISLIISLGVVIGKRTIGNLRTIKISILRSCIKSWFFIGMWTIFISMYISIDQVILGFYNLTHDLGIYSFAYKFTLIYALIWSMLFQSLSPNTAKSVNMKKYNIWIKKIAILNLIGIIIAELFILATYIFHFLDKLGLWEYTPSLVVLAFLLIYSYIEPFGNWGYLHLISMWKEKTTTVIFFISALFNVIGNIILIPKISYYGAIITTIWSYALFAILTHIFAKKFLSLKIEATK